MQQIEDWLRKLGLGQYAQRFAENDINFSILAYLTDQDLKEIGVTSLGHRRQLLRVITELRRRPETGESGLGFYQHRLFGGFLFSKPASILWR